MLIKLHIKSAKHFKGILFFIVLPLLLLILIMFLAWNKKPFLVYHSILKKGSLLCLNKKDIIHYIKVRRKKFFSSRPDWKKFCFLSSKKEKGYVKVGEIILSKQRTPIIFIKNDGNYYVSNKRLKILELHRLYLFNDKPEVLYKCKKASTCIKYSQKLL